jgi:hypothetical protein
VGFQAAAGQRGVVGADDRVGAQVEGGRGAGRADALPEDEGRQRLAEAVGHLPRRAQRLAADGANRAVPILDIDPHAAHMTFSSNSLLTRLRACSSGVSPAIISISPSRGGMG